MVAKHDKTNLVRGVGGYVLAPGYIHNRKTHTIYCDEFMVFYLLLRMHIIQIVSTFDSFSVLLTFF